MNNDKNNDNMLHTAPLAYAVAEMRCSLCSRMLLFCR